MAKTSAYTPHGTSCPRYLRQCRGWRPRGQAGVDGKLGTYIGRCLPVMDAQNQKKYTMMAAITTNGTKTPRRAVFH